MIRFCVMSENSFLYLLYPLAVLWTGALLAGKLPLNEHVCAYFSLNFVWWVKICSFYLLYLLAVLWTGALSVCKLPLNEHPCAYSSLNFMWWVKICSFYLLYPLALLWTDALLAGKLPWMTMFVHTHERILCDEWKFVPLLPLPTCCVVNWCTLRL